MFNLWMLLNKFTSCCLLVMLVFDMFYASNIKRLGPVVQRLGNAIHRINHYPVDSVVCFANTYPLDSDLSGG